MGNVFYFFDLCLFTTLFFFFLAMLFGLWILLPPLGIEPMTPALDTWVLTMGLPGNSICFFVIYLLFLFKLPEMEAYISDFSLSLRFVFIRILSIDNISPLLSVICQQLWMMCWLLWRTGYSLDCVIILSNIVIAWKQHLYLFSQWCTFSRIV